MTKKHKIKNPFNYQETFWEKIYLPFYRFFKWRIYNPLHYDLKYWLQLHFRGWSDDEAWSVYSHICCRFIKPLKKMRANLCGRPCSMTMKQWENILDQIIWSFETVVREDILRGAEYKRQQKGFEFFGKYFMNLWD